MFANRGGCAPPTPACASLPDSISKNLGEVVATEVGLMPQNQDVLELCLRVMPRDLSPMIPCYFIEWVLIPAASSPHAFIRLCRTCASDGISGGYLQTRCSNALWRGFQWIHIMHGAFQNTHILSSTASSSGGPSICKDIFSSALCLEFVQCNSLARHLARRSLLSSCITWWLPA